MHRDVKPGNVLLNADGRVRLCDFGSCQQILLPDDEQKSQLTKYIVTRYYRAPELMLGCSNYDGRVDLADWGILNTANPAMAAAAMSLINSVPEPGSCVLAGVAVAALLACRRRTRG